ncbi:MAG: regulatory protein RecX [Longimicrobiales bacterium]|nr:regulatory protein RecX [Longimicrobiales bacterium]
MPNKGNDPVITRLEPLRPRGLRVRVHLDQGDPLEVALEALERLGLGVGDPLPPNRRHHLLDADAEVAIREAALNLLSHRARTRAELRSKLVGRGFRPARVDPCLDRLEERGLLDDAAVASAFVRDRIRHRPRGARRLTQELRAKGVGDAAARQVVDGVLEEESLTETDLARRVLEGWLKRQSRSVRQALAGSAPTPELEKARRRLYGYLARRGFAGPALSQVMDLARNLPSP